MPYDPSLPTDRDRVRRLIGDVSATPLLADSEIDWVLGRFADLDRAAAECADLIAAQFAPGVRMSVGDQSVDAHQRFAHYTELAKRLRARAVAASVPYAGGTRRAEKVAIADRDATRPFFRREDDRPPED